MVRAGRLRIEGKEADTPAGIFSETHPFSNGNAGTVSIEVKGDMEIVNGGQISTSTYGAGDAGQLNIQAGTLRIDGLGKIDYTGIMSEVSSIADGRGGAVTIAVSDLLEIVNSGRISTGTYGTGDAGQIRISAGNLRIDGNGEIFYTGISSSSGFGASGKAGTVSIKVDDLIELLNGGEISNDTDSDQDAGEVKIESRRLRIDGEGYFLYTGITSDATYLSSGRPGAVFVTTSDSLEILNGGQISSNTHGSGDAQGIDIQAGHLCIDGQGADHITGIRSESIRYASGNAGILSIRVADQLEVVNGGDISSSTFGLGDAGQVKIDAGNLRVDGKSYNGFTGIGSTSEASSSGNAGAVSITVQDRVEVVNGGEISSSTFSSGDAGSVKIQAGELLVEGGRADISSVIASGSFESARGFAGDVDIRAEKVTIQHDGLITIQTHQMLPEEGISLNHSRLFIKSPVVILDQGAWVSARSTGNVPAAFVEIQAENFLLSRNSRVTTVSNEADGGDITLMVKLIDLKDSLITSSVETAGNGGDITLTGRDSGAAVSALILDGGFIQANAPVGAKGGDIFINTQTLIPSGGELEVGGPERQMFVPGTGKNIIQAAAPGGEQGRIQITSPELDISGALANIEASLSAPLRLAVDPCRTEGLGEESSLLVLGAGGIGAVTRQPAVLYLGRDRIERSLINQEK